MTKTVFESPKTVFGLSVSRWMIFISSSILLAYGSVAFVGTLITYCGRYDKAVVVTIVNKELSSAILCTSFLCVIAAIVGILAAQRKDRHMLACHTLLLWPCLALLTTVAYLAYRDTVWDLKTWLSMKWRYDLSVNEQYQLQESFRCCGFQNSADHAVYRSTCSQESLLQGCHQKLYAFESYFLVKAYSICFGLVPIHIMVIIIALMYSRPSIHRLGRYYGNQGGSTHCHDPSTKPMQTCLACENWTF